MKKLSCITSLLVLFALTANFAAAQTAEEVTALVKETSKAIGENTPQTFARINKAEH